ncbi:hypothetical protein ALTERO38_90390 [Alteromonas sp. 38]|nr:hypothetical protein ALTERO38_90390 [Alteromonas sp. 38]
MLVQSLINLAVFLALEDSLTCCITITLMGMLTEEIALQIQVVVG